MKIIFTAVKIFVLSETICCFEKYFMIKNNFKCLKASTRNIKMHSFKVVCTPYYDLLFRKNFFV